MMDVIGLPLGQIIPYARNPRQNEKAIATVAASITEFGFTNPILTGSDNVIIAGHGRLLAAQKLGMDTVPVIILDHLSDADRRGAM